MFISEESPPPFSSQRMIWRYLWGDKVRPHTQGSHNIIVPKIGHLSLSVDQDQISQWGGSPDQTWLSGLLHHSGRCYFRPRGRIAGQTEVLAWPVAVRVTVKTTQTFSPKFHMDITDGVKIVCKVSLSVPWKKFSKTSYRLNFTEHHHFTRPSQRTATQLQSVRSFRWKGRCRSDITVLVRRFKCECGGEDCSGQPTDLDKAEEGITELSLAG
ncbi:uncharacterized protein LOC104849952 [Fukomys damarensis]|uniref:uncharacterized protein LOC104849952 n=1 Tax=Fukomys damarensis TaxID=885580 RepID=UPI00053FDE4B|nr:uncharacterized protein LOC104849952 [Fukomys damarensis]